jgi:hypothetical protein
MMPILRVYRDNKLLLDTVNFSPLGGRYEQDNKQFPIVTRACVVDHIDRENLVTLFRKAYSV